MASEAATAEVTGDAQAAATAIAPSANNQVNARAICIGLRCALRMSIAHRHQVAGHHPNLVSSVTAVCKALNARVPGCSA